MFERFTRNARAVVVGAQAVAARAGATEVRPAHLFESLIATDGILAMHVLADLGAPGDEVRQVVRGLTGALLRRPRRRGRRGAQAARHRPRRRDQPDRPRPQRRRRTAGPKGHKRFARESKKVLELSLREALRLGTASSAPSTCCSADPGRGDVALRTLAAFDLTPADVRRAVEEAERRTG